MNWVGDLQRAMRARETRPASTFNRRTCVKCGQSGYRIDDDLTVAEPPDNTACIHDWAQMEHGAS